MQEYKEVIKTYKTKEISKCVCDRCGKLCTKKKYENNEHDMRTILKINPVYIFDESCELDLCEDCTNELLNWLTNRSNEVRDMKDSINWYKVNVFDKEPGKEIER